MLLRVPGKRQRGQRTKPIVFNTRSNFVPKWPTYAFHALSRRQRNRIPILFWITNSYYKSQIDCYYESNIINKQKTDRAYHAMCWTITYRRENYKSHSIADKRTSGFRNSGENVEWTLLRPSWPFRTCDWITNIITDGRSLVSPRRNLFQFLSHNNIFPQWFCNTRFNFNFM